MLKDLLFGSQFYHLQAKLSLAMDELRLIDRFELVPEPHEENPNIVRYNFPHIVTVRNGDEIRIQTDFEFTRSGQIKAQRETVSIYRPFKDANG